MQNRKVYKVRLDFGNTTTSSIYEYKIEEEALLRAINKEPSQQTSASNAAFFKQYLFRYGCILRSYAIKIPHHPFGDIQAKKNIIVNFSVVSNKAKIVHVDANSNIKTCLIDVPIHFPGFIEDKVCYKEESSQTNLPDANFASHVVHFDAPTNFFLKVFSNNNEIENFLTQAKSQLDFLFHQFSENNSMLQAIDCHMNIGAPSHEKNNNDVLKKSSSALSAIAELIKHIKDNQQKLSENTFAVTTRLIPLLPAAEIKKIRDSQANGSPLHAELVAGLRNAAIEYCIEKNPLSLLPKGANLAEVNANNSYIQEINKKFARVATAHIVDHPAPTKETSYAVELLLDPSLICKSYEQLDDIAKAAKMQCSYTSTAKKYLNKHYFETKEKIKKNIVASNILAEEEGYKLYLSKKIAFEQEQINIAKAKQEILDLRIMLFNLFIFYFDTILKIYKRSAKIKENELDKITEKYSLDLSEEKRLLHDALQLIIQYAQPTLDSLNHSTAIVADSKDTNENLKISSTINVPIALDNITNAVSNFKKQSEIIKSSCQQKVLHKEQELKEAAECAVRTITFQPNTTMPSLPLSIPTVCFFSIPPTPKIIPDSVIKLRNIFSVCSNIDFWHSQVWGFGGENVPLADPYHKDKNTSAPKIIYQLLVMFAKYEFDKYLSKLPFEEDVNKALNEIHQIRTEAVDRQDKRDKRCFGFVRKPATHTFIEELDILLAKNSERSLDFNNLTLQINEFKKPLIEKKVCWDKLRRPSNTKENSRLTPIAN